VGIKAAGGITFVTRRNTMSNSFKMKRLALACALALGILSGTAGAQSAQAQDAKDKAYLDDTRADVVKSGFGLCWHTGFGPPPASGPECDPNYVAYVAPPTPVFASKPVPPPAIVAVQPPTVQAPPVARAPEPTPVYVAPYVAPKRPAKKDRN
jgi:OOP family OmpA-OmpF porin